MFVATGLFVALLLQPMTVEEAERLASDSASFLRYAEACDRDRIPEDCWLYASLRRRMPAYVARFNGMTEAGETFSEDVAEIMIGFAEDMARAGVIDTELWAELEAVGYPDCISRYSVMGRAVMNCPLPEPARTPEPADFGHDIDLAYLERMAGRASGVRASAATCRREVGAEPCYWNLVGRQRLVEEMAPLLAWIEAGNPGVQQAMVAPYERIVDYHSGLADIEQSLIPRLDRWRLRACFEAVYPALRHQSDPIFDFRITCPFPTPENEAMFPNGYGDSGQ
jgi:hypothetical protein